MSHSGDEVSVDTDANIASEGSKNSDIALPANDYDKAALMIARERLSRLNVHTPPLQQNDDNNSDDNSDDDGSVSSIATDAAVVPPAQIDPSSAHPTRIRGNRR